MVREIWKDIPNYEGYYQASKLGRIRSLTRMIRGKNRRGGFMSVYERPGKVLKPVRTSPTNPYLIVTLTKENTPKMFTVHKLVLLAFIGPCPDGMECRHLDGDPENNRLSNIKWGTYIENATDREMHGRTAKGWKITAGKIASEKRKAIVDLHDKCAYPIELLARIFGKDVMTIRYLLGTYKEVFSEA